MLNREIVQAWLDEAATTLEYDEDPVVPEGVESLDPAECDELLARLSLISRAVRFLQESARSRFVDHLGTRGFVRYGNRTYRAAPERKETLRADRRTEFYDTVEKAGMVAEIFPHYTARKTGLRTLAEGWVDVETGEVGWSAFLDHFYDVEEGKVRVSEMPVDRAPKYIQQSPDGEPQKRGEAA